MSFLMLFFTTSLLIPPQHAYWRVQFFDEFSVSPAANVPFLVVYNNRTTWSENGLRWYADETLCEIRNKSQVSTEVVCSNPGTYPFGVKQKYKEYVVTIETLWLQDKIPILGPTMRTSFTVYQTYILLLPMEDRNNTTEEVSSDKSSNTGISRVESESVAETLKKIDNHGLFQVNVNISAYQQAYEEKEITIRVHKLGEHPQLILVNNTLNEEDTQLQLTFDNKSAWSGVISFQSPGDSVLLVAESALNVPINKGCFIRSFQTRLSQFKYNQSVLKNLGYIKSEVKEFFKQDPYSSHVGIVFLEDSSQCKLNASWLNLLCFVRNVESGEPLNYIVEDILMLRNHIAVYGINSRFKYKLVLIDKNGEQYVVPEDDEMWMNFYSCNNIPKGLNISCDFILTLNYLKYSGWFYIYDISNKTLTKYQVPLCGDMYCHIRHMEISVALDLVRILYLNCNFSEQCYNYVVDFYLSNSSWQFVLSTAVDVASFMFFPVYSYDMVFFSEDNIYQLQDDTLRMRYKFTEADGHLIQTSISDGTLIVLMSTGYALYIQYGAINVYHIFLGVNSRLFSVDGVFYTIWMNNSSQFVEPTPILVELQAATNGLKNSILAFNTSIKNILYYLDTCDKLTVTAELIGDSLYNHDIKVIYDTSAGVLINVTTRTKTKKSITGIYKTYEIQLDSSGDRLYPRATTVSLAPLNYDGYYTEYLKPKTMFLSIGCFPGRNLQLISSKPRSCSEVNITEFSNSISLPGLTEERTTCSKLQLDEELHIYMKIFTYDVLHDLEVKGPLSLVYGDNVETNLRSDGHTVLTPMETGTYVLYGSLDNSVSLCELQSYIVVEVINVPDDSRTLIIGLSITIGAVICAVFLSITFFVFKIRTAKEHEAEAEVQKRQQELRYLASLQHYQDQMDITEQPTAAGVAKRRTSSIRRRSSILPQFIKDPIVKRTVMTPVAEE